MFVTTETPVLGFFHERGHPARGELRLFYINLKDIFQDSTSQAHWLNKPHHKLGWKTPYEAVRHGYIKLVRELLEKEFGHYRAY